MIGCSLKTAITDNKLKPLADPKIQMGSLKIAKGQDYKVEFTLDLQPEFEVPAYEKLQWIQENNAVTEEDLSLSLEEIRERRGEFVLAENAVSQKRDMLIGDLEIKAESEVLFSQKNTNIFVLDTRVKGIPVEKAFLLNHKVGDVLKKNLVLPETYEAEKDRGKNVELSFSIAEIKRLQLPAMDDNFAKEVGCENLEALKKNLQNQIKHEKEHQSEEKSLHLLLHQLIEETKLELSEEFIKDKIVEMQARQKRDPQKQETEEEKAKKEAELKQSIIWELKEYLIISKIAEKENIEVTEDEVDDYIKAIAHIYRKWPTEIKKEYEENGYIEEIRYKAKVSKVLEFLKKNAKVVNSSDSDKKIIACNH